MTRSLRIVCLVIVSMIALSAHASTTIVFFAADSDFTFGRDAFVRAAAFTTETGVPLVGATITFTLGNETINSTVDLFGLASGFIPVTAPAGDATLRISFAGDALHQPGLKAVPITVLPQPSMLFIQSDAAFAAGRSKAVAAVLLDAYTGAPIVGRPLAFAVGSAIVTAITDGNGVAAGSIDVPSTTFGTMTMNVTFAGERDVMPSAATQTAYIYDPSPFVIWGGNANGLHEGDEVVFLAPDWSKQVTGGDYRATADFKGLIDSAVPTDGCVTGTCWTAKPGDLHAPAGKPVIGVIVATRIVHKQGRIFGNAPAIAIIAVDSSSTTMTRTGTVIYISRAAGQPGG